MTHIVFQIGLYLDTPFQNVPDQTKLSPRRNFILLKNFHVTLDGLIGSLNTTLGGEYGF